MSASLTLQVYIDGERKSPGEYASAITFSGIEAEDSSDAGEAFLYTLWHNCNFHLSQGYELDSSRGYWYEVVPQGGPEYHDYGTFDDSFRNGFVYSSCVSRNASEFAGYRDRTFNIFLQSTRTYNVRIRKVDGVDCSLNTSISGIVTSGYRPGDLVTLYATPAQGATFILFGKQDVGGSYTSFQGMTGQFTMPPADVEVVALSLFEKCTLSYNVYEYNPKTGATTQKSIGDVSLTGFGPENEYAVYDEFNTTATIKDGPHSHEFKTGWIKSVKSPAYGQIDFVRVSNVSTDTARIELTGDCASLGALYPMWTDTERPYFQNKQYTAVYVTYSVAIYYVQIEPELYHNEGMKLDFTLSGGLPGSSKYMASYICPDSASLVFRSKIVEEPDGWKFYPYRIKTASSTLYGPYGPGECPTVLDLRTANTDKGELVTRKLDMWHEHDGMILCDNGGRIIHATDGDVVSR